MSAFGEWASRLQAAAAQMEASLAVEAAREQARDFLAVERFVTPKRSGRLADSETVDSVTGGGAQARAVVSPHTVYASFRNRGGTISVRNKRVLSDGESFFGKTVTQAGSHYVERSEAIAGPSMDAAAAEVVDRFLSGL